MYRVEISAFQERLPHNVWDMAIGNQRLAMIGVFGFFGKRYTPAHTVRGRPTIKTVERFRKRSDTEKS